MPTKCLNCDKRVSFNNYPKINIHPIRYNRYTNQ